MELRDGKVYSDVLESGKVLTITVTSGAVKVVASNNGGEILNTTVSATTTYGPYLHDVMFKVASITGIADVTEALFSDEVGSGGGVSIPDITQLTRWKAALSRAKAGGGNARMMLLGDSWVNGSGANFVTLYANNERNANIPFRLNQMLNGFYTSSRFEAMLGAGNITSNSYALFDSRVVLTGTWGSPTNLPNTVGGSFFSNTNGSKLSITPVATFDSFEIMCAKSSTQGSFAVDVDGTTSLGTVTPTGSNGIYRQTFTGFSLGAHTVNFTKNSTGNTNIFYFRCWNSAKPEVELIMAGHSGATAATFTSTAQPWEAKNQITAVAADLVYFECTINDAVAGTSIATFKANVQKVIDTVIAAGGDIILGTGGPFDVTYSPGVSLVTQRSYATAMQELAILNNIPFINMFADFVSYEVANPGGLYTDQLHVNGNGYERYAKKLFDLLVAV